MSKKEKVSVPQVKLSGVMRPEDAAFAVAQGVTHIGCVFYENSPRHITDPRLAREIFQAAGKEVTHVLEFRACSRAKILDVIKQTGVRNIQVAGATEADVLAYHKEKINASRVYEISASTQLLPAAKPEATAKAPALLILATTGTELTFPWELLGELAPKFTIVGGGVRPENVRALLTHSPWGINLCAGVERRPGELDHARLEMLFEPLNELR